MSKNKVTLRDIAKECNVSVATVSYVLNHSEKEKISHEMRLKIAETATHLHYVPKIKNKRCINKRSDLVGIIINLKENNTLGKKVQYYDIAAELCAEVKKLGFRTVFIPTKNLIIDADAISKYNLDAVFMIDVDNRLIQKITKSYYVPIIFIDCEVNDPIFCRIYPNYPALIQKAKKLLDTSSPFLIMEDICNQAIKEQLKSMFFTKDIFINSPGANIQSFLQIHKNDKGIILGDILGLEVEKIFDSRRIVIMSCLSDSDMLSHGILKIMVKNKNKAAVAAQILNDMLCLNYDAEEEQNRILLDYET